MRKIVLLLILVPCFFCASFVRAEEKKCYEKSAIIGTWEGFRVGDFFEEECPSKSLEMDILETGGATATVSWFEEPFLFEIKIAGEWKLDCDRIVSKPTSINKVDISLDDEAELSVEEEKKANAQIPALTVAVKTKMENDPNFGKEQPEILVHVDSQYMITKGAAGELYVYKKK